MSSRPQILVLLLCMSIVLSGQHAHAASALPNGFVRLSDIAPDIAQDMRYSYRENFTGRPVPGYTAPACILAKPAAEALRRVQAVLKPDGLSLLVFDCYRPKRAVAAFMQWAKNETVPDTSKEYFPHVEKSELVRQGYISGVSSHSRGVAVDLTIIRRQPNMTTENHRESAAQGPCKGSSANQEAGTPLDMGTSWDCFDTLSHTRNPDISSGAKRNRALLLRVMTAEGFHNYEREWWHFSLPVQGFDRAMDFIVE
jgi:D-alanyl-D-alanine dipeptidase